jgi:hypothetical protein
MDTEPTSAAAPNRRWFQFGLRTLFMVVTLLAAACWVFVDRQRLIRERDDALERERKSQGIVDAKLAELVARRDALEEYMMRVRELERSLTHRQVAR